MLPRQQCAEPAQQHSVPVEGLRAVCCRVWQHRGVSGYALALPWVFAVCTAGMSAPARAADKPALLARTAHKAAVPSGTAGNAAAPAHSVEETAAPTEVAHRAADPECNEREAQVLAALREGIVLRGRPEMRSTGEPPPLYVKSTWLPLDWFMVSFTPADAPDARRVARHKSWSGRKPAALPSAVVSDQPGSADVRRHAGQQRIPPSHAAHASPPETGDVILPAARWEEQPEPSLPNTRKGNPLRSPVRSAKGNPLRQ